MDDILKMKSSRRCSALTVRTEPARQEIGGKPELLEPLRLCAFHAGTVTLHNQGFIFGDEGRSTDAALEKFYHVEPFPTRTVALNAPL